MNGEWKTIVQMINKDAALRKTSDEVRNTVSSWNQEVKDLCLLMSRKLNVPVTQKLKKSHKNNPEALIKAGIDDLITYYGLYAILDIPDAAAPLNISVDITRKSIECSMIIEAPTDKNLPKAQVTWLMNQLKKANCEKIEIRSWHRSTNKDNYEQHHYDDILENPKILLSAGKEKILLTRFEIVSRIDLGGKFFGQKTFIDEIEKFVPDYYNSVGRFLRVWVPPAPKAKEPIIVDE